MNAVKLEVNTEVQWTAIAVTYVEYPKGDAVGYALAWCSLLPVFICIVFATLIIFQRDLFTMSYFAGLILNEGINWVVKHYIQEFRPLRSRELVTTVYGMPSSHAQFMSFFAAFLVLFLFIRIHGRCCWWQFMSVLIGVTTALLVSYSRKGNRPAEIWKAMWEVSFLIGLVPSSQDRMNNRLTHVILEMAVK